MGKQNLRQSLSDVEFLDLKSIDNIKELEGEPKFPVPVVLPEDPAASQSIGPAEIEAGLVKILALGPSCLKGIRQFEPSSDDLRNRAVAYYKKLLLLLHPGIEKDLLLAGIAKTEKGEYDFAQQLLSAAKNIGKAPQTYVNLAVLYAKKAAWACKEKKKALEDEFDEKIAKILHEGLENNPDDPYICAELGGYHLRHRNSEEALDFFQKSLEKTSDLERRKQMESLIHGLKDQVEHENAVASACDQIMLDHEDKALTIIEKFLLSEPDAWEGWYVKGWALRRQAKYEEAKNAMLQSIKKNPSQAASYNELAICERELGNLELSKEYLETAVELEGDNVIYLANLAYLYLSEHNFDKARYFLEKARCANPDDSQVLDLMDEYEALSGEKLGPAVREEIYSAAEVGMLSKNKTEGQPEFEEI